MNNKSKNQNHGNLKPLNRAKHSSQFIPQQNRDIQIATETNAVTSGTDSARAINSQTIEGFKQIVNLLEEKLIEYEKYDEKNNKIRPVRWMLKKPRYFIGIHLMFTLYLSMVPILIRARSWNELWSFLILICGFVAFILTIITLMVMYLSQTSIEESKNNEGRYFENAQELRAIAKGVEPLKYLQARYKETAESTGDTLSWLLFPLSIASGFMSALLLIIGEPNFQQQGALTLILAAFLIFLVRIYISPEIKRRRKRILRLEQAQNLPFSALTSNSEK